MAIRKRDTFAYHKNGYIAIYHAFICPKSPFLWEFFLCSCRTGDFIKWKRKAKSSAALKCTPFVRTSMTYLSNKWGALHKLGVFLPFSVSNKNPPALPGDFHMRAKPYGASGPSRCKYDLGSAKSCYLVPVNGSLNFLSVIWSVIWSSFNWFLTYSAIAFSFFPTLST